MSPIHKNSVWNFAGLAAPLLVALVAVPKLVAALGPDAFGLLALAWTLIGYFSLLDLGLGRALSHTTAARLAGGGGSTIPAAFWTSLLLMALIGLAGAALLVPCAPWVASRVLHVPAVLAADAIQSLRLLAASVPVLTVSAALRGHLEGRQQFVSASAVRMGMGLATFAAPLFLLPYTRRMTAIVASLVAARLFAAAAYFLLCLRTAPELWLNRSASLAEARRLLRFGSWMTVSNIVSPMMTYMDRFVIGAILSVSAVAYYVTPFEVAARLLLISSAVTGVLFPALSGALVADPSAAAAVYRRSLFLVGGLLLPCAAALAVLGGTGLSVWIGAEFARNTQHVLPILALGVLVNGIAGVPFSLIQAAGRPDLTAKLHLAEAPLFAALCWTLTLRYGIDGAAWAWTARVTADAAGLFFLARKWAGDREAGTATDALGMEGSPA